MGKKEKKVQQNDTNKKNEYSSVLENIRKRTGLLVGIVGLALLIFILESLLGSGASIFGGDEYTTVGSINGHKVDRNDFMNRLENRLNMYRQRNQGAEVDETVKGQAIDNIWQQYVVEFAIKPQFEKAGIIVGEDELYEKVVVNPAQSIIESLTDPNTGRLSEQFARPDGSLDLAKWKQAVQSVVGDQEMAVRQMEDEVKNTIYFQKFRSLVKKGLYVTRVEALKNYKEQNTRYDIEYVFKPYHMVSDSAVKISDADIKKYYTDHTWEFMSQEPARKIEYVTFNVNPSPEDMLAIEQDAKRAADELKGLTPGEDSVVIAQESENGNITIQNFTKQSMIIRDSSVFTAAPGTVFGPYNEGAYFKVYKLQAINSVADSARVRHILVALNDPQSNQPKRSKEEAKREADSLLVLIKNKKVGFDSLVTNFSDDPGSKSNGGDYGWFDENQGFVEPFKNAGLMGTKGNISVVETQFGYHIIEVLDVSKTKHTSYKVAQIFKPIVASDETNQNVFMKANQFAAENNTAEKFDKAVVEQKLSKRLADNVKESDRQLPGLDGSREMTKWAYTAQKGEVGIFTISGKHIVAKLSGIKNKGVLPLDEVRDEVAVKARQQKKTEIMIEEFSNKAANSTNMSEIASRLGLELYIQEEMTTESANISRVGRDVIIAGVVEGTKKGAISKPRAGEQGVFILAVKDIISEQEPKELGAQKRQMEDLIGGSSDYLSFNALKEMADIKDNKSRVD